MFLTCPSVAFAENIGDDTNSLFDEFTVDNNLDETEDDSKTNEDEDSLEKNSDEVNNLDDDKTTSNNDTEPSSDEATTLDGENVSPDKESTSDNSSKATSSDETDTESSKGSTEDQESLQANSSTSVKSTTASSSNEAGTDSTKETTAGQESLQGNSSSSASSSASTSVSSSASSSARSSESSLVIDDSNIEPCEPETITVSLEENEVDNLPDEETLFAKYVDKQFGVDYFEQDTAIGTMLFRRASAYSKLNDNEKKVYDKAYELISSISSGQTSNTELFFTPDELGISPSEILVEDMYEYSYSNNIWSGRPNSDKINQGLETLKEQQGIDATNIVHAIISDHPELLYWFGREYKIGISNYSCGENSREIKKTSNTEGTKDGIIKVSKFAVAFSVSQSYGLLADESHFYTYKADTEKTSKTSTALANAQAIADSCEGLDDFEKLVAFKEKICSLVKYNTLASKNNISNMGSDPWELIYVFDNDPETNVVCEGYSKAFQYLCDISNFDDYNLYVLSVSGDMTYYSSGKTQGGPHMWNIVHYNGQNYLTDVTNCDEDNIEQGNTSLFMKGYTSGDVNNGYIITKKIKSTEREITYKYSNDMLSLYAYDLSELALNDTDYSSESMPVDPFHYTIKFDRNTGTSGTMGAITNCINGKEYQLTANAYKKDCSKFAGWNTKSDGTGKFFSDGMTVSNLATEEGQIIRLYAQWEADPDICDHKAWLDGEFITCSYVITKDATATEYGTIEKRCDYCGKVIESKNIHPYDTYRIEKSDGTIVEIQGYFDHDYAKKAWELTNKYRKENGLNELEYNESTQNESDIRALETKVSSFSTRPNGQSWNSLTAKWAGGAELRNNSAKTPEQLMENWTKYSTYSTNLLGSFAASSVGCFHVVNGFTAKDGITEKIYWAQQFTLKDAVSEQTATTKQPESANTACQHNNKDYTLISAATCIEKAKYKVTCKDCRKVIDTNYTKLTDKCDYNNHIGYVESMRVDATVKKEGTILYVCKGCGASYTKSIPKLTCQHDSTTKREENGVGYIICKTCGKKIGTYNIQDECTHTYGSKYVQRVVADEKTWGETDRCCSKCGKVLSTEKVHPYKAYTVVDKNGKKQTLYGWFDYDSAHKVAELTNQYRKENGTTWLSYNECLQYASDIRALEAAVYWSHTRPNGTKWNTVDTKWTYGGENLGSGYTNPADVMVGWKNSPGHNRNLLFGTQEGDTPYKAISVSCFHKYSFSDSVPGKAYETLYWSQHFTFYAYDVEKTETQKTDQKKTEPQTTPTTKPENKTTNTGRYRHCEWEIVNGKSYWYENNVIQGTFDDPNGVLGDGTVRGREIYDPASDGWYWLDSVYEGAKACGKEVWMPYIYQNEDKWDDETKRNLAYESDDGMGECVLSAMKNKTGKWVRYDENGRMLKGWVKIEGTLATIYPEQEGNIYYYDNRTGLMAKGHVTIGGVEYYFDEVTGALR